MIGDVITEMLTAIGPPERKNWRLWLFVSALVIVLCVTLSLL